MSCCWEAQAPSVPSSPIPREAYQRRQVPQQQHPRPVQNAEDQSFVPPRSEQSFVRPLPPGCQRFSLRELEHATQGFSDHACVGDGGFGKVYRGYLDDGTCVAIKMLDRTGLQGDKEFEVEINVLARLRYKHLVTLRGACAEQKNRIAVFDFMPGGSLRDNLDRRRQSISCWHSPPQNLLWPARIEVALGAAKGLRFLHEGIEPGMIHRDVKSSNVLLDSEGKARIADFGLAIHTGNMSGANAYQYETPPIEDAEIPAGTYAYTSPEYRDQGILSQKSDVYAFGVVLLELLTGLDPMDTSRPEGMHSLVEYLFPRITSNNPDVEQLYGYLDPVLPKDSVPVPQLMWFCEVAAGCLQPKAADRPKMSEVVGYLAKLDTWKAMPVETTPSGRRFSTSDRTENGRYTLRSLMDDEPLNVPPIREGVDLLPVVRPLSPGVAEVQPLGVEQASDYTHGPPSSGNPFSSPSDSPVAPRQNDLAEAEPTYLNVDHAPPQFWPTMPLDSQNAAHQPAADPTVSPARTPSPNPAWNSSPIAESNARQDMDATYSPLRSSITGMFSKHTDSATKLDAYSYDLQPTGPLQDGLQHNNVNNTYSESTSTGAAKTLFAPERPALDAQQAPMSWVSFNAR